MILSLKYLPSYLFLIILLVKISLKNGKTFFYNVKAISDEIEEYRIVIRDDENSDIAIRTFLPEEIEKIETFTLDELKLEHPKKNQVPSYDNCFLCDSNKTTFTCTSPSEITIDKDGKCNSFS